MKTIMKLAMTAIIIIIIIFANSAVFAQNMTKYYFYDNKWYEYKADPISLKIGGQNITSDMPPIIIDNRSVVPARVVFEKLGAKVNWDKVKQEVEVSMNNTSLLLKINNKIATINGAKVPMDVPAKIVNDRTMIPVRFVAEKLGLNVNWDEKGRVISIDVSQQGKDQENKQEQNQNAEQENQDVANINITKIDYEADNSYVNVVIEADSKIDKYSTLELDESPRVVLDINDAILLDKSKVVDVGVNNVIKVRYAQNQLSPAITRVVIDLKELEYYKITLSKDKKKLIIGFVGDVKNNDSLAEDSVDIVNLINGEDKSDTTIDIKDKREDVFIDPKALDKYVVIDAGHGGKDPGAVVGSLNEKDLNLDMSLRLYKLLKANGIKVLMTRKTDVFVELKDRAALANKVDAQLFVSIHNNAMSDPTYDGTMTLYYPSDYESQYSLTGKEFAEIMQKELVKRLRTEDLGLRERPLLVVLNKTKMPSVLLEIGFMTNDSDRAKLKNDAFRQESAEAMFLGIVKALNESVK